MDKVENEVFSVSGFGLELVSNNVQLKLEIMLVVLSAPGKLNEVKDRLQLLSQSQCWLHSGWVMKEKTYLNPFIKCLLQLCGDVEVHPGPRQSPQPDGAREGDHHDCQGHDKQPMSTNMGCDLQVTSLNVRGLSDAKKVRHLVNSCYKLCRSSKNSIFLLQETFVPMLKLLDYLWRGEYHLTPGTGNSLGCITLISSPFKILHRVDIGQRGHVLVVAKNDINKADAIVVNIYAPNGFDRDKLSFFEDVLEKINEVKLTFECNNLVLGGDLNVVFGAKEVLNRAISAGEARVAESVKNILNELSLTDGWTEVSNPSFTWGTNRNGSQAFSTLDRICYTKSELDLLTKQADWAMTVSDHAAVTARFNNTNKKGYKSNQMFIPRLDSRLLDDKSGSDLLLQNFTELLAQMDMDWNPHVRLEFAKVCIRSAANMT